MTRLIPTVIAWSLLALLLGIGPTTQAQTDTLACGCEYSNVAGAIWWGSQQEMTVAELVAYAAPLFWFSPDEPSLNDDHGPDIMIPEPFPFQESTGPLVYYQITEVVRDARTDSSAYTLTGTDKGTAVLDLKHTALLSLEYYAYYSNESGFSSHPHDVEPVEFRIAMALSDGEYLKDQDIPRCGEQHYILIVTRITGKAHGIQWYWNILNVDTGADFPMTLLVEEGKHAMATDKNGDGYFTPSYDVNVRINDAWGVRDIISSGGLFSGGYQAWMTKVRHPQDRLMPPLPEDSPLAAELAQRQPQYTGGNAVYELRPLPTVAETAAYDEQQGHGSHLQDFLKDKEVPDGPKQKNITTMSEATSWISAGALKRSLSIAAYADGRWGFSWSFPFFVVKNLMIPMSGGYILQRMYLKGPNLSDFGWTLLYTSSASRWVDTYFAAGAEWHDVGVDGNKDIRVDFVMDTGLKFRTQVGKTPLKFLSFLTDFWGIRIGIKNYGFFDIDQLTYVFEIGAGSF